MAKSPEATFRIGNCSASVFVNESNGEGTKREFRSVSLQRSYRDGDDKNFVSNFAMADLPAAIRCLQLAQNHVESKEAMTTS